MADDKTVSLCNTGTTQSETIPPSVLSQRTGFPLLQHSCTSSWTRWRC